MTIWYLVFRNTLEELLCAVLHSKQAVLNAVLDGEASDDGLDVFEDLVREVKRRKKEQAHANVSK